MTDHTGVSPSEARRLRITGYRLLGPAELERILAEQVHRRDAALAELRAVVSRWAEVRDTYERLSLSIPDIEGVLLEKRKDLHANG